VRNGELFGDAAGIVDVLPRAARTLFPCRGAGIVKLQGNAHDVIAGALHQRGRDRGIDAARHGRDDPRLLTGLFARHGGLLGRGGAWLQCAPSPPCGPSSKWTFDDPLQNRMILFNPTGIENRWII